MRSWGCGPGDPTRPGHTSPSCPWARNPSPGILEVRCTSSSSISLDWILPAIIPKGDFLTVCLLGQDVDRELIIAFFNSPAVKNCFPAAWNQVQGICRCAPRINVREATVPYMDRVALVGDCGVTRLYKDGIGAAYRTAKAAAITAVFSGISSEDFQRKFWPACRAIEQDNTIGKIIFVATRQVQKRRYARRAVLRMVTKEQQKEGKKRRMSM